MPIIKVTKAFKYSEDGLHVALITVGEHDVSDKCADMAVNQLEVAEYVKGKQNGRAGKDNEASKPKPDKKAG